MVRRVNSRGFTLIEVLVVVAILAIGLAIAIPNLTAVGRSNAVKAEARQLKNLLERTRIEAIRRGQTLTADFNVVPNSCRVTAPDGTVLSTTTFNDVNITTSPNNLQITWNTRGMTNNNFSTITLAGDVATYNVMVSLAGNIRIAKQ